MHGAAVTAGLERRGVTAFPPSPGQTDPLMQDRRTGQRQEQKVKCGIECPGEPTESFPWREQGLDLAMPGSYPVPVVDTRDVLKSPVPQVQKWPLLLDKSTSRTTYGRRKSGWCPYNRLTGKKRGKKNTAPARPQCLEHGLEWARGSRGPAEPRTQTRADICLRLDADLGLKGDLLAW